MSRKITIVDADDWVGIYIDGKLVTEDHSFNERQTMDALDIEYDRVYADSEWLAEVGNLPDLLSEVREV